MRKTLTTFILVLMLTLPMQIASASSVDSPEQAYKSVVTEICHGNSTGLSIFASPEILDKGTVLETWRGPFLTLEHAQWFVFIDDYPGANWEHDCRYILIDPSSGKSQVVKATRPPTILKDMIQFQGPNPFQGENLKSQQNELKNFRSRSPEHLWAVIISGGAGSGSNHIRYWNDCSEIYKTLVNVYGYLDENIIVAIADGLDPAPDQSSGQNSDPDLDGDGDDDIMYSATVSNLNTIFSQLTGTLGSLDSLFIFTTDHGSGQFGTPGQPTSMNLWNSEIIWDHEFAALLEPIQCREIMVTMEPCFSGGFVNDVIDMNSTVPRVISTAANDMEYSWAMPPDYVYDTYVFHWTAAVRGMDAYGTPVDADTNQDGEITMDEAYQYAVTMDQDDEHPQYGEWPEGYGSGLTLAGSGPTPEGIVRLGRDFYNCSDEIDIMVEDLDLQGTGILSVLISSQTETVPEPVVLNETDIGHFEGIISTAIGTPSADGVLQVAPNNVITVTYHDDHFGESGPMDITDNADVDCTPPIISGVFIAEVSDASAIIRWETDEPATSRIEYGMDHGLGFVMEDDELVTSHTIMISGLSGCTDYYFQVVSEDEAMNACIDSHGGQHYFFTTLQLIALMDANMDTDPGWNYQGQWAWGQPTGASGDPSSGYTGSNVVGYNLNGSYPDNMTPYYATSVPFDCSGASQAYLSFWKWLGIESSSYDHATVEISINGGSTWDTIWAHEGGSVAPTSWTFEEYDISEWAAGQSDVRVRWGMGPSDGSVVYCGWNLDDVRVSYTMPCNVPVLMYQDHHVDDSTGNNDGEINPGEQIALSVTLRNQGLNATGVTASLMSSNPHVTITQSFSAYPDIDQSQTGTSLSPFTFTVSPEAEDGEMIPFIISWTSAENSGSTGFSVMIVGPQLQYYSNSLIEQTGSDYDGIWDPGERIQLQVTLTNQGNGFAHNVSADLSSNLPEYITITDHSASFPDIAGGEMGQSLAPSFMVTAASTIPDHSIVTFTLAISAEGYVTEDTFEMEVTLSNFARRIIWTMDTDPGWTTEGQWAWGVPQGSGGDPAAGYTGQNVYGYNLAGTYPNNMPETSLTSTPIDCSHYTDIEVRFMRWLGIESATWDHASFRVSTDGLNWTTIWDHTGSTLVETSWNAMTYNISAVADGQPTVYLRWVMGRTDSSVVYCGWNIDDVEIYADSDIAIPTPTPTSPPTCIHDGDVNDNGSITAGDAQLAFSIALGVHTPTYEEECAADCNGNGSVTAGDAQGIFGAALGIGSCTDPLF